MPILVWMQDQKNILTTANDRHQFTAKNGIYFINNEGNITENKMSDSAVCAEITYDNAFSVKMSLHCIENRRKLEKFTCFAINAFGQDSRTVSIETVSAPNFKNHSNSLIEVLDGFPATIICDASGYPKPTVIWQKVS